jgi:hypothetical protein
MATISYKDIGAVQRKEGGSGSVNTSYKDIGAAQRQEVVESNLTGIFIAQAPMPALLQQRLRQRL